MADTAVPQPALTDTGFTAPAASAIFAGVFADLQTAFDGALSTNLETPQGQLASSLTAIISAANDLYLLYTQQIDPATASGRMQDAIGNLYNIGRLPATSTTVTATLSGATATTIPVGSLAVATDGTIYSALTSGTIPAGGTLSLVFAATTTGPIACPAGSLNRIYRTIPGWDSITNPADGFLGRNVETRAAFEARRSASVAANATGILPAVRGAVLSVSGVADAFVTENATASAVTIGGVSVAARSLYVAVQGGTDADVARAIWTKKNPGCGYTGTTTVNVTDLNSGYVTPPSYPVTFTRPTSLGVTFVVTLVNGTDVPSNVTALVQAAISARFQALARIGQKLYASQFYGVVSALGAWVRLETITINGGTDLAVNINQFPAITATTVTLI